MSNAVARSYLEDALSALDDFDDDGCDHDPYADDRVRVLRAVLEDVARDTHAFYAHSDPLPFCRAIPCGDIGRELEDDAKPRRKAAA